MCECYVSTVQAVEPLTNITWNTPSFQRNIRQYADTLLKEYLWMAISECFITNNCFIIKYWCIFPDYDRNSHRICFIKKAVLKNFTIFTEKQPVLESLFNKVAGLQTSENFKNTYFEEYPALAASVMMFNFSDARRFIYNSRNSSLLSGVLLIKLWNPRTFVELAESYIPGGILVRQIPIKTTNKSYLVSAT